MRINVLLKKVPIALLLMTMLITAGYAQEATITGRITDGDSDDPLVGATVLEKGTTNGTITDINGNYSIKVSKSDAILQISYIGYLTEEVLVNNQSIVNAGLTVDVTTLDELVVIGYGSVKKSDATGAVAVINTDDFNKGAINSPQELISGKTAGVSITSNSGAPGNTSTIRVRGGASISASNDPLIVIDGVPMDNEGRGGSPNLLSILNPNDIQSVTVLKDASSTAIYGSRASNGVLLITTKSGKSGFKINYNVTTSLYTPSKKVDVYSGDEYRVLMNQLYAGQDDVLSLLGDANTDWQDEIYKNAFGQDHNLSVSGTAGTMPYRVSLGYNNTDGILKTYNYERTSVGINLDPTFLDDHLKLKVSLKGINNNNNFAEQGAIANAIYYDPTQPVYNGNTRWRGFTTWTLGGVNGDAINLATPNPVAQLALTDNTSNVKRSIGNAQIDYKVHFLPDLHVNLNLGYDYGKSEGHNNVADSTQWVYIPTPAGGRITRYERTDENELLDFYLSYNKEVASIDSKFDAMLGYSWVHSKKYGQDSTMNQYEEASVYNNFANEYYLVSFFGRLNYTFKNKYLLTFSLRNDGSSRFAPDQRWGIFPAAAFAWDMDQENFLKDNQVISDLKLRLGYGITGQQDLNGNYYPYFAKYTISNQSAQYRFGDTYYQTLRPDGYDAFVKWETTTTYNAGFDYGFLSDRITGTLDYYYRKTYDLLNTVDVPVGTNFSPQVLTNVSTMVNQGLEFNLNAVLINKGDLHWELGYNIAYNRNNITKLNLNNDPNYIIPFGGIAGSTSGTIQVNKLDQPVRSFYVYQQIYDSNGQPLEGVYVDRDYNGIINSSDLYVYKKPDADVLMGINSHLNYKNWDFSFNGRASLGNYVYNNVAANSNYANLYSTLRFVTNSSKLADDTQFTQTGNYTLSDYYIENASFFRMDNINLGYRFNEAFNTKLNIRVSAGVQNAFIITKYKGLDPEISGGLDNNFYPRPRVFVLGLNCDF
ncbi:SusC/RagA family TonB-linked outer membrane protein [Fulvivirga ligni]|uniref:SusC/RagA family TonB-linked outer membrane protein n=1 Tax=Fulvivirga ligni TaxID=2904246 RepID=UPI001F31DD66|nr:TonB-dependent receptor [Fulvivirga ligni]UII21218.1 TonB-dependent receptor [Fulvivirga ligni]